MQTIALGVLAVTVASGCGLMFGNLEHRGPNFFTSGTITKQSCSGGQCTPTGPSTNVTVMSNMGLAFGTTQGYANTSVKGTSGEAVTEGGFALRFYADYLYHFTPSFTFALEGAFQLQNLSQATSAMVSTLEEDRYLGFVIAPRIVFGPPRGQFWVGGGYSAGSVGIVSADSYLATAGFHRRIGTLLFPVYIRVEGSVSFGENDFRQQMVTGGFSFWAH